jgi:hypothetical protein
MTTIKTIDYFGARLEVVEFLAEIWPYELPLDKWPSFCGLGDSWGDKWVPEKICGIPISCVCFDHDVSFSLADGSQKEFIKMNLRMYRNVRSLVIPNIKWWQRPKAESMCFIYFAVTTALGFRAYESQIPKQRYDHPLDNPEVHKKLHRLAMATLNYPGLNY